MKKNKKFLDFIDQFKSELLGLDQEEFDALLSKNQDGYTDILKNNFLFEDTADSISCIYGGLGSTLYDSESSIMFAIQGTSFVGSLLATEVTISNLLNQNASTSLTSALTVTVPRSPSSGAIILSDSSTLSTAKVLTKKSDEDDFSGSGYSWAA